MNYKELDNKIDKICAEVDELIKNDITTLESTGRFLYQIDAYGDGPQDGAQYKAMLKHIAEVKNEETR